MENLERTALFVNFSDEAFTGFWNSQPYEFSPGQSMYMEYWKAKHFAKHLVNRELLKLPEGEKHQSPKNPEQDPLFMDLFNKAVFDQDHDVAASKVATEVMNMNTDETKPKKSAKKAEKKLKATPEEEFEGLTEET